MSDWWTNTSAEPSSGAMNPKPLVALNHFTVPAVTSCSLCLSDSVLKRSPDATGSPFPSAQSSISALGGEGQEVLAEGDLAAEVLAGDLDPLPGGGGRWRRD